MATKKKGKAASAVPVEAFDVPMGVLRAMATHTAKLTSRYSIEGVLLECRKNAFRAVATDGKRMAIYDQPFKSQIGCASGIVSASDIRKIPAKCKTDGRITIPVKYGDPVLIVYGNVTISAAKLDANFPPYDDVVPTAATRTSNTDMTRRTGVNAKYLAEAAKLCGTLDKCVSIEMYGHNKPIKWISRKGDATMTVVLLPISLPDYYERETP